ncbi:EVE domain-containing protein [Caulobacter sp. 17J80-11]|uniref:EVE domain-containing protein n=1 Tax=Caulobacter sp. 17J80-11 TaxID=2763502 RepID=UPI0016534A00|nr:EVE domain-containing protein [Caulobacter sp. 17J80-11]MBC6982867.1 HNH endonuclease [Caulobacter sp. 17J80-11]
MQRTWLFQGNPERFDLTGFFASKPAETDWSVSRYKDEIAVGDRVFIWRSGNSKAEPGGVIAEAVVLEGPRLKADSGPAQWWRSPTEGDDVKLRARLGIRRIVGKKTMIKRDWLKGDPAFHDHLIMQMPNHTTFKVEGAHLERLDRLWANVGSDWTYAECVAGLWAYVETHGGPISELPGSTVANVAMLIGRPVSGVYNRVMNYRSLDPRDARKGFDGGGDQAEFVWDEFYDVAGAELRAAAVRAEFARLWGSADPVPVDEGLLRKRVEEEAEELAVSLSLEDLLNRYGASKGKRGRKPASRTAKTRSYERDPLVGAIARRRSGFTCEVSGCSIPLFIGTDGVPYVEVHHIRTLADGGEDTPENVACLCPAHHREIHFGKAAAVLTAALRKLRGLPDECPEMAA